MKTLSLLVGIFYCTLSYSQISLNGSSSSISIANNAPAIVVDNALTITGTTTLDGARVSVSTNFSSGDVLAYTGTLPSGVTGSYNSTTGILTFTGNATPANYQALLRTVTFNTTASSVLQRTVLFNLGTAISFSGNDHFYEFISGSFSWTTAKTNAAAKSLYGLTGYLATITSQSENDFIQQKLGADGWIGSSDAFDQINLATGTTTFSSQTTAEGKWYWVTGPEKGTKFSNGNNTPAAVSSRYMNWNSGEPNDANIEHYGEIYSSGTVAGKWNDLGNSNQLGYVVEYGGLSGDPVVSLTTERNIVMMATEVVTTSSVVPYRLNTTATIIDNALLLYSSSSIADFRVTISANFKSGDVLSTTGTLPSGVTASYSTTKGILSFTGTATAAQWQALLRTVKFNSTSVILGDREVTFSAGSLPAFTNGHFYEFVSNTATWSSAKTKAAAKTYLGLYGYLATITSQEENDFIKDKLAADGWTGGSDNYSQINAATGVTTYSNQTNAEGKFYWVTGPVGEIGTQYSIGNTNPASVNSKYMNWNTGEPNYSGASGAELIASGANLGKWSDVNASSSLGYFVEYGGLSSDAVVVLSANRVIAIDIALPLTGLQFSARKADKAAELNWSTLTEINTAYFEIQQSGSGGGNFKKIGQVTAAGNSDNLRTYQFTDQKPTSGINYYRLKQVDIDGHFTFSQVKVVVFGAEKIQLSPNPATTYINLTLPETAPKCSVRIMNINGQPLINKTLQPNQQIITVDITSLSPGTYIAEVETNGAPVNMKFIKK